MSILLGIAILKDMLLYDSRDAFKYIIDHLYWLSAQLQDRNAS